MLCKWLGLCLGPGEVLAIMLVGLCLIFFAILWSWR